MKAGESVDEIVMVLQTSTLESIRRVVPPARGRCIRKRTLLSSVVERFKGKSKAARKS